MLQHLQANDTVHAGIEQRERCGIGENIRSGGIQVTAGRRIVQGKVAGGGG